MIIFNKYRNITIPYFYNYKKKYSETYIYKNKYWFNLNDLFIEFLGFYLNYHIKINENIVVVHSLEEVASTLLLNYPNATIPKKYKNEYSSKEYLFFEKMLCNINELKQDRKIILNMENITFSLKDYWWYKANKSVRKENKTNLLYQTYSKVYHENVWVLNGTITPLLRAIEEICNIGFYYQYSGDGKNEYSYHEHQHEFENVIKDVFFLGEKFVVYDFQKQFFSKQELFFLKALKAKLENIGYIVDFTKNYNENFYYSDLCQIYWQLRDQNRKIQAYLVFRKIKKKHKKLQKMFLKNHKIKY